MKSILNLFFDLLFREECVGCKQAGWVLCSNCLLKIRRAERETARNIFAVFDYRDPIIKNAIWRLKYYKHSHVGEKLGQILYEEMLEEISNIRIYSPGKPIMVIPVPLSSKREKMRGYNQSERIASGFCDKSEEKIFELCKNIIIKKIDTAPQAKISNRNHRLRNIRGAFYLKDKDKIKDRTILVIDDVTTTGGTIGEIEKILKEAGAKKVVGVTIAH